jgi:hypothetical protein
MGGKRSADRARPKESADPRPLVERLLQKGYSMGLIASDTGMDIKEVRAIKAEMVLPELLAEVEEEAEEVANTEPDPTPAGADPPTASQTEQTPQAGKPDDWRELTEDDLEEKVLDRAGVIDLILTWLQEAKNSHDDIDSVGSALDEAQVDASAEHRKKSRRLPMQLRRESDLMLHRIALWKLGKRGRGGSSEYRVIKDCQTQETAQP